MRHDIPLAHEETYKGHRIEIHYDTDAESPAEWDSVGTLVTWTRNYTFQEDGQKQYGSPAEFFESLADIRVEDLEWRAADGKMKYNNRWYDEPQIREIVLQKARENAVWINVGMGDHSGIWLYEGHGAAGCDPGGWDSGGVGFLYVRKDKLLYEQGGKFKTINKTVRDYALQLLRGDLENWDNYVRGNVYGFTVHTLDEDGESNDDAVESCWGYYPDHAEKGSYKPDYEFCLSEARDTVDYLVNNARTTHFAQLKAWIRNSSLPHPTTIDHMNTTAKQNINNAPDRCWVAIAGASDGSDSPAIVMVLAGEMGYHPVGRDFLIDAATKLFDFKPEKPYEELDYKQRLPFLEEVVDLLNRETYGVTRNQMEAMRWGSMFGWESPAASADYWDRKI